MDEELQALLAAMMAQQDATRVSRSSRTPPPSMRDFLDSLLQPETGRGTAALVGTSMIPGVGTGIDLADILLGLQEGNMGRAGIGVLGAAIPFMGGPQLRAILEIGGKDPDNPFFRSLMGDIAQSVREGGESIVDKLGIRQILQDMNLPAEQATRINADIGLSERLGTLPARGEGPPIPIGNDALERFIQRAADRDAGQAGLRFNPGDQARGSTINRRAAESPAVRGGRRAEDPEADLLMQEAIREALVGMTQRARDRVSRSSQNQVDPIAELGRLLNSGG